MGYLEFIEKLDLPKCPFEKFDIKIFHYGYLAFVREFLGDFVVTDAVPSGQSRRRLMREE